MGFRQKKCKLSLGSDHCGTFRNKQGCIGGSRVPWKHLSFTGVPGTLWTSGFLVPSGLGTLWNLWAPGEKGDISINPHFYFPKYK